MNHINKFIFYISEQYLFFKIARNQIAFFSKVNKGFKNSYFNKYIAINTAKVK